MPRPVPFPRWIQCLIPAPKRLIQQLAVENNWRTGLDIGCGEFSLLSPLRPFGFFSTGIDICAATVKQCRARQVHDSYLTGDFMQVEFKEKFDIVVLSHVIEHFDRDAGVDVLRRIESIARHLVYVETPYGFLEQRDVRGNPYQRHRSGWFPHDFQSRGYTVFGQGPRCLRGSEGKARYLPESLVRAIERLTQFYYFRHPYSSFSIGAVRFVDELGNLRQL
jgi:SAM-dependent methyltransferase